MQTVNDNKADKINKEIKVNVFIITSKYNRI